MKKDTKKIAAVAAVMRYIRDEEDMLCAQAATSAPPAEPTPKRCVPSGMWAAAGRQDIMQMGNMMQMKAFHGSRLR